MELTTHFLNEAGLGLGICQVEGWLYVGLVALDSFTCILELCWLELVGTSSRCSEPELDQAESPVIRRSSSVFL